MKEIQCYIFDNFNEFEKFILDLEVRNFKTEDELIEYENKFKNPNVLFWSRSISGTESHDKLDYLKSIKLEYDDFKGNLYANRLFLIEGVVSFKILIFYFMIRKSDGKEN